MSRRLSLLVESDVPQSRSLKVFGDLLGAAWGVLREEPVGPMEPVGIGFLWTTAARGGADRVSLPRPWSLIRNGLIERGAIHPRAHVYMLRGEVVNVRRGDEQPRLIVALER